MRCRSRVAHASRRAASTFVSTCASMRKTPDIDTNVDAARWKRALQLLLLGSVLSGQTLPEGAGKDATKKICGNCHEIATVISSRRTKIAWEQMVDDMITRGA